MTYDLLSALVLFAFVSSITPGPNNLMLMASGANFGFKRTIPHMLGIGIGFTVMIVLVGVGLKQVFDAYPVTNTILKIVSVLYLLYLAWKIANSGAPQNNDGILTEKKPFTFIQAALFQWVNPKAWTMAVSATTIYAPDNALISILVVAGAFGAVNLPSVSTWVVLGLQMKRFLTSKAKLRAFNLTMALLLIASLYPVVLK